MIYPVFDVSSWSAESVEELGTKKKVWLQGPAGQRWLFKQPRPTTGEHWAEKIACEVAGWLQMPHALYDLADLNAIPGVIVLDLTEQRRHGELVLGNAVLHALEPGYEKERKKPVQHTVDAVVELLGSIRARASPQPPEIQRAADIFVGYLMLDALVGNTDRHHENWGLFVRLAVQELELAPTFDHASSLGRELSDAEREERMTTRDAGFAIEAYCAKARSPFFSTGDSPRLLRVREVFERAAALRPDAARFWLRRLGVIPVEVFQAEVDAVPDSVMTAAARCFARGVLECNHRFLLSLPRHEP